MSENPKPELCGIQPYAVRDEVPLGRFVHTLLHFRLAVAFYLSVRPSLFCFCFSLTAAFCFSVQRPSLIF
jgi:hypothetical protein